MEFLWGWGNGAGSARGTTGVLGGAPTRGAHSRQRPSLPAIARKGDAGGGTRRKPFPKLGLWRALGFSSGPEKAPPPGPRALLRSNSMPPRRHPDGTCRSGRSGRERPWNRGARPGRRNADRFPARASRGGRPGPPTGREPPGQFPAAPTLPAPGPAPPRCRPNLRPPASRAHPASAGPPLPPLNGEGHRAPPPCPPGPQPRTETDPSLRSGTGCPTAEAGQPRLASSAASYSNRGRWVSRNRSPRESSCVCKADTSKRNSSCPAP